MKSHARVVIIGGGSLGVNLLYHLTKEGWTDIALVEKGELTSGSTWHAAGLCGNFIGNHTVSQIHNYTIKLYNEILPQETGQDSSFHQTGSIRVGFSKLEEQWFRNLESRSKNIGFDFNIISKAEARELNPFMNFDKARIIASTPNDGHVDPTSVVMPLSKLARDNGAEVNRFTRVVEINALPSGEWEVVTDKGSIVAEHVVNASGCFAREVGAMVGVNIPLTNLEHQYLVTEKHPDLEALGWELPVCRDSWSDAYIRQEGMGFLVGPYEMWGSKPWALGGMDWDFDRELFEPDLDRLMPFLERCFELTPKFEEVGVKTVVNGPITHTPDDNILAGPQAGLHNFWNLCGAS
ncbi:MAG: FAD-binding oxidoreductase, partial [Gammaproteobacteria bacterium]|nr:FAD-binding oxidoreductase [Gammaproteobacteria bacterium]